MSRANAAAMGAAVSLCLRKTMHILFIFTKCDTDARGYFGGRLAETNLAEKLSWFVSGCYSQRAFNASSAGTDPGDKNKSKCSEVICCFNCMNTHTPHRHACFRGCGFSCKVMNDFAIYHTAGLS